MRVKPVQVPLLNTPGLNVWKMNQTCTRTQTRPLKHSARNKGGKTHESSRARECPETLQQGELLIKTRSPLAIAFISPRAAGSATACRTEPGQETGLWSHLTRWVDHGGQCVCVRVSLVMKNSSKSVYSSVECERVFCNQTKGASAWEAW